MIKEMLMDIYKDPSRPVSERVEDLLSKMTLEEKVAQLCGDLPFSLMGDMDHLEENLKKNYPDGHGRFTQYSNVGLSDPKFIAAFSNRLQKYFVEETRLGIPVALQSENLCGYPAKGGTLFPASINTGCTWEPELAEKEAKIIGQESRAVGINSSMSPVIDISRDPRWGRTYENYGEDPYLTSQMGIAYVKGMQDDKKGTACIAKHFLGYSETQAGLNTAVTRLTDRELYEVFATPFEAAMKEADLSSVMANYAEIDGMPVVHNKKIARELLRDTMGFEGILTSDGAGIMKTFTDYHTADSYEEAGLLAKKAGTDTEIPVGGSFKMLPKYVKNGELDEKLIDESVRRVLKVKFEYGLFENPYVDVEALEDAMTNDEKQKLSYEIAGKSLVLLKNDSLLPLKKGIKVALIGPHADSLRYPVSGYTYPAYIEMFDASRNSMSGIAIGGMADEEAKNAEDEKKDKKPRGPFAQMALLFSGEEGKKLSDMNTVLRELSATSLKEEMEKVFDVRYAKGCDIIGEDRSGFDDAIKTCEGSDVIVFACGGNSGWVNVTGGEGKDRSKLDLPGVQQELLEKLCATNKPVILILYGPGIFATPWACEHTAAMIEAFMPGPFAGKVITEVLTGDRNPGGKLTMSIPRSVGQVPVTYNHRTGSGYVLNRGEDPVSAIFSGGYVDDSDVPLFCFGHGLSYTTFKLSDFCLEEKEVPVDSVIRVSCTLENTGDVSGDEVVQLYFHTAKAHVVRPVMELAGFKRVSLKPGEKKKVSFFLDTKQLGYYNEDMEFVVQPTKLDIMIGTSAHDIVFKDRIDLVGEKLSVAGKRVYTCPVILE